MANIKMNLRTKILAVFFVTTLFMIIVGMIAIWSSHNFIQQVEFKHQHFRSIIRTATQVSTLAKKAESHLYFFLIFRESAGYDDFLICLTNMDSQIKNLQIRIQEKDGKQIVSRMAEDAGLFLSKGKEIKRIYDQAGSREREFQLSDHPVEIRAFHDLASELRRDSVRLTVVMTQFLNRQTSITSAVEVSSYAKRAETHLLLFLTLHDPTDRTKFFARVTSLKEHIRNLKENRGPSPAQDFVAQMEKRADELKESGEEILAIYDRQISSGIPFQVRRFQKEFAKVHTAAAWLRDAGVEVEGQNVGLETQRRDELIQKAWGVLYISLFIMIFGFIISIFLSLIFSRKLTAQISRIKSAAQQIGRGNFDVRLNIETKDEIGELAGFVEEMAVRLKSLTEKLSIQNKNLIQEIEAHKRSNDQLKLALEEVRQLSGLLPICASCKKIRDDKGYWNQIDAYIQKHTQAKFSHSLCPGCSEKLYGEEDWYIQMKDKKKKE